TAARRRRAAQRSVRRREEPLLRGAQLRQGVDRARAAARRGPGDLRIVARRGRRAGRELPSGCARTTGMVEMPDPAIGRLFVAGNPIKLADVPDPSDHRAPPELDADRAAILEWLRGRS